MDAKRTFFLVLLLAVISMSSFVAISLATPWGHEKVCRQVLDRYHCFLCCGSYAGGIEDLPKMSVVLANQDIVAGSVIKDSDLIVKEVPYVEVKQSIYFKDTILNKVSKNNISKGQLISRSDI